MRNPSQDTLQKELEFTVGHRSSPVPVRSKNKTGTGTPHGLSGIMALWGKGVKSKVFTLKNHTATTAEFLRVAQASLVRKHDMSQGSANHRGLIGG